MPGAMIIVFADFPKELPGENIQLVAAYPMRKLRASKRDMSLQDPSKHLFMLGGWISDSDGARYIRRAIKILAAAVHQVHGVHHQ